MRLEEALIFACNREEKESESLTLDLEVVLEVKRLDSRFKVDVDLNLTFGCPDKKQSRRTTSILSL